jgi:parallel beta-helix repeat protein
LIAVVTAIASATSAMADAPRTTFNVRNYGAAGDGTTDDTAAIQRDALPPFRCLTFQGRRLRGNLDCRADGNACLGIFAPDTSLTVNTITATGSARSIHAEGPLPQANRIEGNKLSPGSGDGMLIVTPSTGGSGSVITGNTIKGSGACGIYVSAHGAANAGGNTISHNTISGFTTPVSIH